VCPCIPIDMSQKSVLNLVECKLNSDIDALRFTTCLVICIAKSVSILKSQGVCLVSMTSLRVHSSMSCAYRAFRSHLPSRFGIQQKVRPLGRLKLRTQVLGFHSMSITGVRSQAEISSLRRGSKSKRRRQRGQSQRLQRSRSSISPICYLSRRAYFLWASQQPWILGF